MKLIRILFVATCLLSVAMAAPVINLAGNAASYDTTLARGSMVVLIGSGLGPSPIQVATSFPLLTTFAGASVQVTVNGVTTDGIMFYASDGQSAFVLDSDTPAGSGTLTLTYNGQTSAPFPITVVDSNIGFYTLDSSGTGAGVVTFHDSVNVPSPFPSDTNAINPGDLVIVWANGLGPVPFDETIGAEFLDMTDVPLQLFVNGQQVETFYQGRSPQCCTSVDNFFFYWPGSTQPAKTPPVRAVDSCSSTITALVAGMPSNSITIQSAPVGTRVCSSDPDPGGGGQPSNPLDSIISPSQISQSVQDGNLSIGIVALDSNSNYPRSFGGIGGPSMEQEESAFAVFAEIDANPSDPSGAVEALDEFFGSPTCTTSVSTSDPGDINFFGGNVGFNTLDAGPGIFVNSPNRQITLTKNSFGGLIFYGAEDLNGFLTQGPFRVESPGGPDVNSFMATSAQGSGALNWLNRPDLATVVRSAGVKATWSGQTVGYVTVSGTSSAIDFNTFQSTTKSFSCTGPAAPGSLSVSGDIVSHLDASNAAAFQFGTLSVEGFQLYELPGTGLDFAVFSITHSTSQDTEYQ